MRNGLIAAALAAALLLTGCGGKDDVQGKTGEDITAKSSADDIGEDFWKLLWSVRKGRPFGTNAHYYVAFHRSLTTYYSFTFYHLPIISLDAMLC